MPGSDAIKPSHKAIQRYYEALQSYGTHDVEHETALRSAFQNLLADTAKSQGWILVPEQRTKSGEQRQEVARSESFAHVCRHSA